MEVGFAEEGLDARNFFFSGLNGLFHAFQLAAFFEREFPGTSRWWLFAVRFGFAGLRQSGGARSLLVPLLHVIIVTTDAVLQAAFTFECKDGGANAVQEVAVMADNQHHAGECDQRFLEDAQSR